MATLWLETDVLEPGTYWIRIDLDPPVDLTPVVLAYPVGHGLTAGSADSTRYIVGQDLTQASIIHFGPRRTEDLTGGDGGTPGLGVDVWVDSNASFGELFDLTVFEAGAFVAYSDTEGWGPNNAISAELIT